MEEKSDAKVWIGGEAGDGIASVGDIWIRTASRLGLGAYAHNSYQSVIRGGHVLLQSKVGKYPILSQDEGWDVLMALDQQTIDLHGRTAGKGGWLLHNSAKTKAPESLAPEQVRGIPVSEIFSEAGSQPVMQNTVLLGALIALLDLDREVFEGVLRTQFGKRKAELLEINLRAAKRGWDYAKERYQKSDWIARKGDGIPRMMITGNQAIGYGALAGGCTFYAAYPMTPASTIMHWLAPRAEKHGLLMKQTEDEIAAINMAIGAGFAGARPMVGTSGGGFALMTEAIGMAGMVEVPVTIVLSQRGGPSTGLPTKTEQGDLFQALGASQGEFPKAVIAPLDVADAYAATIESLNLADRFQMPVILLSDLELSEHVETVPAENLPKESSIDRGEILAEAKDGYLRYENTATGISPRVLPGTMNGMHTASTDEHNEAGWLVSDVFTNPSTRKKMMEKRMRKMIEVRKATDPHAIRIEGAEAAEVTLIGWGSTYSVLKEARLMLEEEGIRVNHLQVRTVWPFPAEQVRQFLKTSWLTVCVENNYGGLLERLIRQETGIEMARSVRKYDGEPFGIRRLVEAIRAARASDAPAQQVLVSSELDIPMVQK